MKRLNFSKRIPLQALLAAGLALACTPTLWAGPPPLCTPATSCITSGFNGTSINPANSIWFNANFKASGIPATGATITFNNSRVIINGTSYPAPGATIIFSPCVTCATTTFNGTQWITMVPVSGSDEILLSAFAFKPTTDLRAASVTWCGDFSATTSGISISWKWGAAVYTCLGGVDYNTLRVKPAHNNVCGISNGDHAGTPECAFVKKCVIGGARGGGGANFTGSWSGTTSISLPSCPATLWPDTTVPATVDSGPDSPVELGVKFRSDLAGTITGIRFYKAAANTGPHVANLWSSTGALLGSALFTDETASGWQQVQFPAPIPIAPNTVYVASYWTGSGHYSIDLGYFATKGLDNPPLHALPDGVWGGNGVFAYVANSTFPDKSWSSANYWVDVIFQAGP